jgi:hypothetical protein
VIFVLFYIWGTLQVHLILVYWYLWKATLCNCRCLWGTPLVLKSAVRMVQVRGSQSYENQFGGCRHGVLLWVGMVSTGVSMCLHELAWLLWGSAWGSGESTRRGIDTRTADMGLGVRANDKTRVGIRICARTRQLPWLHIWIGVTQTGMNTYWIDTWPRKQHNFITANFIVYI